MRTICKIMILFVLLIGVTACDEEIETVHTLEVNASTLNGSWQLTEWNGNPLAVGTYCYITFIRKDKTYKMYQKFDSMYARCITGTFDVDKDDYLGYIISGVYDYGMGVWNNSYIVSEMLPTGSMTWIVKENSGDISKYVRCDKVPQSIIDEAKEKEN